METNQTFVADLHAPIKSFRLFALEQVIKEGASQDILEILCAREPLEDDDECRLLLSHAIVAVKRRLGVIQPASEKEFDAEDFLNQFSNADAAQKMDLLSKIPRKYLKKLAVQAPKLLENEENSAIASTIIKLFSWYWPIDRIEMLTARLETGKLSMRLAVLEALIQISPQSLVRELPKLLVAEDPRTRALAILGLSKIDLDEAIAHLEALFMSSERHQKMAAIQNGFYFPFDRVKPLIFKFFAAEVDLELLERAGLLLQINPDIEVPVQLWEIAEMASPAKAEIIKKVIAGSFSFIEKTGILGDTFQEYKERLQQWIYQRNATRFVQETINRLSDAKTVCDAEFEAFLTSHLRQPMIRRAFQEALKWQIPEAVKVKMIALLKGLSLVEKPPKEEVVEPKPIVWEALTKDEKISRISSWGETDKVAARPLVKQIFEREGVPVDLRATALRACIRLSIVDFCDVAEKYLCYSDELLVVAALEYLGAFNPDRSFPYLGKIIQSKNPRVVSGALKLLNRFDPPQALMVLKKMLAEKNDDSRSLAVSSMTHFDFPLVREMLAGFLETNPAASLLDAGLCLFQANPDFENLFFLYRIEKYLPAGGAQKAKETRQQTVESLKALGRLDAKVLQTLDQSLEEQYKKEQEKAKVEPPAYSIKRLQPKPPRASSGAATGGDTDSPLRSILYVLPVLIMLVGGFLLWPQEEKKVIPDSFKKNDAGPISPISIEIRGLVKENLDRGGRILLITGKGESFLINGKNQEFKTVRVGKKVKATVVPYQKKDDGAVLATLQAFEVE